MYTPTHPPLRRTHPIHTYLTHPPTPTQQTPHTHNDGNNEYLNDSVGVV